MKFRLAAGRYERVRAVRAAGWHRSEALGLELRAERWLLRFHDPRLGRDMPTHAEAVRERDEAVLERDTVARERDEANQRIRELEARLRLSDKSA